MRSHLTAFGLGAGLVLLVAGVALIAGPRFIEIDGDDSDEDGVSIVNIDDGDSGSFQIKDGKLAVTAKWKGAFAFAGDARSLTSLAHSLEIESREGDERRKATFENKDGKILVSAVLNDAALAGPEADTQAATLLQTFARASGVNAEERLKALIADGGKSAAIGEIKSLAGGHAVGAYVSALSALATLDEQDVKDLSEQIAGLSSDYAKRRSLGAMLKHQKIGPGGLQAVLGAAKTIKSDHEVRLIIEALSENPMTSAHAETVTALLSDIESDHETRLAVEALVESKSIVGADAARAVEAAISSIDGDYEKRLVVEAASARLGDADMDAAAIKAAGAIKSGHDRRLAIETVAGALSPQSPVWLTLIRLAEGVEGDHERRLAIESLAEHAPRDEATRGALAAAAASIGSDHDRRLAQDALN